MSVAEVSTPQTRREPLDRVLLRWSVRGKWTGKWHLCEPRRDPDPDGAMMLCGVRRQPGYDAAAVAVSSPPFRNIVALNGNGDQHFEKDAPVCGGCLHELGVRQERGEA